jgi:hypothetical protein
MPATTKPCCCKEMKAIRAELERRARGNGAAANARAMTPRGPFSGMPTAHLVRTLRDRQRAIYGTDDRKDIRDVTDPSVLAVADSVVALVEQKDLRPMPSGRYRLATTSYKDEYGLCDGETFADQPLGCFCSGFLVAPDVVATAGHCVRSTIAAARTWFVFGFRMRDRSHACTEFAARDVYRGARLVGRQEDADGSDWALVQLDRPVVRRTPLRVRSEGKIADGRNVFVIGHPCGLPAKFAGGATVRSNRRRAYFVANLDTYGGNSGSPVFDRRTKVVEGILVSGETDFVAKGDCNVSMVCPDAGCQGEDVSRSTLWTARLRNGR